MVPRPQPAPLKPTVGSGSVLFSEKRLAEFRKQRAHGPQNKGVAKYQEILTYGFFIDGIFELPGIFIHDGS